MASAEAYRALVERLEGESRRSPVGYKLKVALLASLGFVVLGGAVLLAFGVSVGLVLVLLAISPVLLIKLIKVVWIPVAFGWLVLRALWVKFSPPDGHVLAAGEAPLLRAEVERLRAATSAPKLDGIIIDSDLNAAAASVPRALGLLGHRHYLVLGLPLMQLLDRDQFASVVAHEFGHFGGGHGRFSGWIYRVRVSWYRLLDALSAQRSWANGLFVKFFDWYAPYFNAYSFVLARANEYQADAAAARAVGNRAAGHALIRVDLGAARLERDFWPGMQRATRQQPAPPALLYRDMATTLRSDGEDDAQRLSHSLARLPGFDDTHPTLAQRLAALGVEPAHVPPPQRSAAEDLLGDLLPELERRFSDQWREGVEHAWAQNHRQHAQDLQRLAELDALVERNPEEVVEHARLREELEPGVDAVALYRDALASAPEHAFAHYRLGVLLLARGDASGAGHLWDAMRLDPQSAQAVLSHLEHHYRETADYAGLDRVDAEWKRLQAAYSKSQRAREELTSRDEFEPHALDGDALATLKNMLEREGGIGKAWLARKRIPDDPHGLPHFTLLVKWRGMVFNEDRKLQRIVDGLELPGSYIVFTAANRRGIARKLRKVAGEPILRNGWW